MTAVAMTYPFDVLRARMAAFGAKDPGAKPPTYTEMCRALVKSNGVRGLYRVRIPPYRYPGPSSHHLALRI